MLIMNTLCITYMIDGKMDPTLLSWLIIAHFTSPPTCTSAPTLDKERAKAVA
ncbi:hypothetical protein Scep_023643 [Stephania cephalantha]|uniref:Uncharacterized protein n=1 Tax=Stephania cephalantha TaxID=152367 RepID=A0AAP0HSZ2_9MAGN